MTEKTSAKMANKEQSNSLWIKGPYRKYLPADTYWKQHVGRTNNFDRGLCIAIAVGFAIYELKYRADSFTDKLLGKEKELFEVIEFYRDGKFHLGPLPPFGFQLYSLVSHDIISLRKLSLYLASATLALLYLTLRRTNSNPITALLCVISIGYLPLYQIEASSISFEPLQWFLLALSFNSWQSVRSSMPLTGTWMYHMCALAVSLGLGISTKFIGFFTWIWIGVLAIFEFWNILGDVEITNCQLFKYGIFKIFFLAIMPLAIFSSSYIFELNKWSHDTPEFSTFMSSNFKAFLRGPLEQPKQLYYGSTVILRHLESLGGYLHSHNYTYKSGSFEQQVSLVQNENDPNIEWVVEHRIPHFNTDSQLRVVKDLDKVRLRHRMTGKLLRASSAKPPVSEQDYDSEISCTGDITFNGDSDETWSINNIRGAVHDPIEPAKAVVKFNNEGHRCSMISHDIRLPERGLGQQEVLCVEPATQSRSLFQIETVKHASHPDIEYAIYGNDNRSLLIKYYELITELVQRQYRFNNYEKNYKIEGPISPGSWPFQLFESKFVSNIWISTIVPMVFFVVVEIIQLVQWNPWKPGCSERSLKFELYQDFGIACCLGWFLHFYPFIKSPNQNLNLVQYMPSLIIGQLFISQSLSSVRIWHTFPILYLSFFIALVIGISVCVVCMS